MFCFFVVVDVICQFRRLLDDPLITGISHNMTARERRSHSAIPPELPDDAVVHASDGAARNQGAAAVRQAFFGCVRYQMDTWRVIAKCRNELGDVSNNVAEYASWRTLNTPFGSQLPTYFLCGFDTSCQANQL